MLTKGAIGNLINRYKAVLKKCNLINTFGSLAVASMLVMGGAGVAGATSSTLAVGGEYQNGGYTTISSMQSGNVDYDSTSFTTTVSAENNLISSTNTPNYNVFASLASDAPKAYAGPTVQFVGDENTNVHLASSSGYSIVSRHGAVLFGSEDKHLKSVVVEGVDGGTVIYATAFNYNNHQHDLKQKCEFYADTVELKGVDNKNSESIIGNGGSVKIVADSVMNITGTISGYNSVYGGVDDMDYDLNFTSGSDAVATIKGDVISSGTSVVKIGLRGEGSSLTGNVSSTGFDDNIKNGGLIELAFGDKGILTGDIVSKNQGDVEITFGKEGTIDGRVQVASGATATIKGDITFADQANSSDNTFPVIKNDGTLTVEGATFSNNKATFNGGTIYGGAIASWEADTTLTDVTFSGNSTSTDDGLNGSGGGLYARNGKVTVTGGTFENNYSGKMGGAVYLASSDGNSGEATFTNVKFIGNKSRTSGAGVVLNGNDASKYKATFENVTFENNIAGGDSGALYVYGTEASFKGENTFTGNQSTEGGAIRNWATINFSGTNTFSNNTANGVANDIYNTGTVNVLGGTTTLGGGLAGSGSFNVAEGATLALNADKDAVTIDSAIVSQGTISVADAAVFNRELVASGNIELADNASLTITRTDTKNDTTATLTTVDGKDLTVTGGEGSKLVLNHKGPHWCDKAPAALRQNTNGGNMTIKVGELAIDSLGYGIHTMGNGIIDVTAKKIDIAVDHCGSGITLQDSNGNATVKINDFANGLTITQKGENLNAEGMKPGEYGNNDYTGEDDGFILASRSSKDGGTAIIIDGTGDVTLNANHRAAAYVSGANGSIDIKTTGDFTASGTSLAEGEKLYEAEKTTSTLFAKGGELSIEAANITIADKGAQVRAVEAGKDGKISITATNTVDITGAVRANTDSQIDVDGKVINVNGNGGIAGFRVYTDYYAAGKSAVVNIGSDKTESINISNATYGIRAMYNGTEVNVKGKELNISDVLAGIWSANGSVSTGDNLDGNRADDAKVLVGADTTVRISDANYALVAMSQGTLDIAGNLYAEGSDYGLVVRGEATVNINEANDASKTVQLTGDIIYDYSDHPVDSDVTINLANADSFFKGSIYNTAPADTLEGYGKVTGMALGLANGATWENTGDSFVNTLTMANGGIVDNDGGDFAIAIDKFNATDAVFKNAGNITIADAGKSTVSSFTQDGGHTVIKAGELTISGGEFKNAELGAIDNKGTLNFAGINTFSGNKAGEVANDIQNEGTINITGGTTTLGSGLAGAGTVNLKDGSFVADGTVATFAGAFNQAGGTSFVNKVGDFFGGAVNLTGGTMTAHTVNADKLASFENATLQATNALNLKDVDLSVGKGSTLIVGSNALCGTDPAYQGGAIDFGSKGTITVDGGTFIADKDAVLNDGFNAPKGDSIIGKSGFVKLDLAVADGTGYKAGEYTLKQFENAQKSLFKDADEKAELSFLNSVVKIEDDNKLVIGATGVEEVVDPVTKEKKRTTEFTANSAPTIVKDGLSVDNAPDNASHPEKFYNNKVVIVDSTDENHKALGVDRVHAKDAEFDAGILVVGKDSGKDGVVELVFNGEDGGSHVTISGYHEADHAGDDEHGIVMDENGKVLKVKVTVEKDSTFVFGHHDNTELEQSAQIAEATVSGDHFIDGNGAHNTHVEYDKVNMKGGNFNLLDTASVIGHLDAKGGRIYIDPAYVNIHKVEGDTVASELIIGSGSVVEIGAADAGLEDIVKEKGWTTSAAADNGFLVDGDKAVLSLLGQASALKIDGTNGYLAVDPTLTKEADGATYKPAGDIKVTKGGAYFAPSSLLVVDGANVAAGAAIAGAGTAVITVAEGADLYIRDAKADQSYTIAEGFKNADSKVEGWQKVISNALTEANAKLTEDGKVIIAVDQKDAADALPGVIPTNALNTMMTDNVNAVDSADMGIQFLSRAVEPEFLAADKAVDAINEVSRAAVTAGVQNTALRISDTASNTVVDHMSLAQHDGTKAIHADGVDFWAAPMYGNLYTSGMVTSGSSVRGQFGGLALGADLEAGQFLGGKFRLGAAINGGGGQSETKGTATSTQNDYDFGGLNFYAGWNSGSLNVIASVGYGFGNHEVEMGIPVAGVNKAKADIDTSAFTADLRAEYQLKTPYVDILPHAGIRYTALKTDAHDLKIGGSVLNSVQSDTQNIVQFPVGVTLSKDFDLAGWTVKPSADVSVIPAAGDKKATTKVNFSGLDAWDSVNTRVMDSTSWAGTIGIQAEKGNMTFGLNYGVQASSNETDQNIQVKFGWKF